MSFERIRRIFRIPVERPRDVEREVDDELSFHIAMRADRLRQRGVPPDEAAAQARRRFGNVDSIRAECVSSGTAELRLDRLRRDASDLVRDLRLATRSLRRSPGFSLAAVALLAVGMGGTTAVFSIVNAIYFRPLPFPNADRLALVSATVPDPRCDGRCVRTPAIGEIAEWERSATSIDAIGTTELRQGTAVIRGAAFVLEGAGLSASMPELLGLRAAVGRGLVPSDFAPNAPGVIVLSHSAWRGQFGGDSAIVGQIATMNGVSYRVVGVLSPQSEIGPPIFSLNVRTAEYVTPRDPKATRVSQTVARLRDGATWETAQSELGALLQHVNGEPWKATVQPLRTSLAERYKGSFPLLLGAAAVVLLVTCLNVGGLFVARLNDRMPELATRTVLGAGRLQLVQQVAIEALLIASGGALGGLAIGYAGTSLTRLIPADRLPFWTPVVMDGRVVAAALGLALFGAIALSIAPLGVLSPSRVLRGLRELVTAAPTRARARGVVVSVEIALSVVLVATAGMLVKQLVMAERRELGSSRHSVVFLALLNRENAGMDAAWRSRVIAGLGSLPGVVSVSVSGSPDRRRGPAADSARRRPGAARAAVYVDGRPDPADNLAFPGSMVVSNEYFSTIGKRILSGRGFTAADNAGSPAVAVINLSAARRAFPNGDAVGRRIRIDVGGVTGDWLTIVGVVADPANPFWPKDRETAELFRPWAQVAAVPSNVAVRVGSETPAMAPRIRDAFRAIDPSMPVASAVPVEAWIDNEMWSARFTTDIISAFAAFAVLLACLGVYATVSYVVGGRRRELAIRVAVGATREDVVRIVMRSSAAMLVIGLAAGLVGSFAAWRFVRALSFGPTGLDLPVLAGCAVATLAAGLAAAYLPARRAARADPAAVLRAD